MLCMCAFESLCISKYGFSLLMYSPLGQSASLPALQKCPCQQRRPSCWFSLRGRCKFCCKFTLLTCACSCRTLDLTFWHCVSFFCIWTQQQPVGILKHFWNPARGQCHGEVGSRTTLKLRKQEKIWSDEKNKRQMALRARSRELSNMVQPWLLEDALGKSTRTGQNSPKTLS